MEGRPDAREIAGRLQSLNARIAGAAARAGRDPGQVRLMGVTKTVPPEVIRHAYDAGLRLFGENYVQEGLSKIELLPHDASWHMIGHLQSNKAKKVAETFASLDSLDRPSLADALNKAALARGVKMRVLIEVNLGGEDSKAGCDEEGAFVLAGRCREWPGLSLFGLMCLPPYLDDPEEVRPYFKRLKALADRIAAQNLPGVSMDELSMGMSHDFETAVEEGATIVRVGTALFGARG